MRCLEKFGVLGTGEFENINRPHQRINFPTLFVLIIRNF